MTRWAYSWIHALTIAIARIADDAKHYGKVYNVVQQHPVPADHVFAHMETLGYIRERAPVEEWKSGLAAMADREEDMELKILARSLESVEPYLADTRVYDISRFTSAIAELCLTMPEAIADYVTMFLRT